MSYSITIEGQTVVKRFGGSVSGTDLVRSAERVASHPDFGHFRAIVNDFTAVTAGDFDAETIEDLAAIRFGSMASRNNLRVIVIGSAEWVHRLVAACDSGPLKGSHQTLRFDSAEQAQRWIDAHPLALDWHSRLPRL